MSRLRRRLLRNGTVVAALVVGGPLLFQIYALVRTQGSPVSPSTGPNALWLAHTWVGDAHTDAEYAALAGRLIDNRISDAFFHVGPLNADGGVSPERFPYSERLVTQMQERAPGVRLQAWLGQIEKRGGGPLDLSSTSVRGGIVRTGEAFMGLGFDGIHLDIEPIHPDDRDLLLLLDEMKAMTVRLRGVLSIATDEVEPARWFGSALRAAVPRAHPWTVSYHREVMKRTDQIAVMTYDSAMPTAAVYSLFVRRQVKLLAPLEERRTIFIGIATYDSTDLGHRRSVENVATGVRGVRSGLSGLSSKSDIGVAIYADWTTDDAEWTEYRQVWLGP